jgi:hypothetical protein
MKIPIAIRYDKNVTVSALFGAATLLICWGVINWFITGFELNWLGMLLCFSGFIYIALGVLARWVRLPAALVGATLYAAFLVFECFLGVNHGVNLVTEGFFFKIPIVILLLVAVVSALQCSTAYKVVIMSLVAALIVSLGFLVHALRLNTLWKSEVSVQAIYDGSEQAKQDFQNGRLRLFEFHGENGEDKFSGRHQGQFEIWYAEYHPSVDVQRIPEEKWVETYNQFMKLWNSWPSNSTPANAKSAKTRNN